MSNNNLQPNIVLTGFMGTGKTSVGRLIAQQLNRPFVDTDEEIVGRAGMSIPEIFVNVGEARFRHLEKEVARELATRRGLVIATGGGMLVDEENRTLMQQSALVVCLNAEPEVLIERLMSASEVEERPLLKENPVENMRALLEKRRAAYATISYQVDTNGKTVEQLAQEIVAMIQSSWLTVDAPGGAYEILIQPGILARMKLHADDFALEGRVIVATNSTLAPLYGEALTRALPNASLVTIADGEQYKTLDIVSKLYTDFLAADADRDTTIVALGGGVLGDTVGFAAATYLRGLRLIQVPTTLLAMVDSSVGGKVGVDLPQGKNLVGAFKQPDGVLIDPDVLKTLPPREWRCGMAEVIKHGLIADTALLNPALHHIERAAEIIRRAVQVKIDIVQRDPYEANERAFLNLGHTFAHAIERVSNYAWLHGEAVGVGLLAAVRLSHRVGLCDHEIADRVEGLLASIGLPWRLTNLDSAALYDAMATDKKRKGGKLRFVLLEGMNKPTLRDDVSRADVIAVLDGLK
jgi:3-dehydroquinate synthase